MSMLSRALVALSLLVSLAAGPGHASEEGHGGFLARPDGHAPIGVMGDHMHAAGEVMFSYRYERMRMDDNQDGTSRRTDADVLQDFIATPTDMDMEMHMFGVMYAPTDWLTLGAMLPYVRLQMDHVNRMGRSFVTHSDGPGDFKFTTLWKLFETEQHHLHLNLGMSFPTGGIRHSDQTPSPMGGFANTTLPFPMQIGSGTYDTIPGLTYVGNSSRLSWGAQALGTIRADKNEAGWAQGNRADVSSWIAFPWSDWVSTSARISYHYWGNYRGDENRFPPTTVIPTADPNRRAGHRIDLHPGVNFYVPLGPLRKHRFSIEAGIPVYQWLDGPQLRTQWQIMAGWQFTFDWH